MSDPVGPEQPETAWRESLARSKSQIASGEIVALLPILDRLKMAAERLETEQGVTADGERLPAGR